MDEEVKRRLHRWVGWWVICLLFGIPAVMFVLGPLVGIVVGVAVVIWGFWMCGFFLHPPENGHRRRVAVTPEVRNQIYARDGFRCVHCGSRSNLQLDHIVPFSQGGSDDPDNLQTLCGRCNVRKGNRYVG